MRPARPAAGLRSGADGNGWWATALLARLLIVWWDATMVPQRRGSAMLVVTRYRVDADAARTFLRRAQAALAVLARCSGWRAGHVGRAVDDPTLWILTAEWADVGSYRRALLAPEVRVAAVPLLGEALDEPSAFELLTDVEEARSAIAADADVVGIGEAAAPIVATDLDRS